MKKLLMFGLNIFLVFALVGCGKVKMAIPEIKEEETKIALGDYRVAEDGIRCFKEIIEKTQLDFDYYNITEFNMQISRGTYIESFYLLVDIFDNNKDYLTTLSYAYEDNLLTLTQIDNSSSVLVYSVNESNTIDVLNQYVLSIPLKEQIDLVEYSHYFLMYREHTIIEEGQPIYDGRNNQVITALSLEEYRQGKAGISDGQTNTVFRFSKDDSTMPDFSYVFGKNNDIENIGNSNVYKECDYVIQNGMMKITRDFGQNWIQVDVNPDLIKDTLNFHREVALPKDSIFINKDETLPIAFFTEGDEMLPIIQLSNDNGASWKEIKIPLYLYHGEEKPTTRRTIGFLNQDFGYMGLGTDYSMGSGETKGLYLSFDGGETWTMQPRMPEECYSYILKDFVMVNEQEGLVVLDAGMDKFFPLVYVTKDGAQTWTQIELPYTDVPTEVQYISEIDSLTFEEGQYKLVMAQGNIGNYRIVFTADSIDGPYQYIELYKATIHTVG